MVLHLLVQPLRPFLDRHDLSYESLSSCVAAGEWLAGQLSWVCHVDELGVVGGL
jgi:hypothetical protein